MTGRRTGDSGQAFPIYITVMAGLLFLAFVYFAVGQAAATRNGAQTAADAAALAAAQDARNQLRDGWLEVILDPAAWDRFLNGESYIAPRACERAASFAAKNDAELWGKRCARLPVGEEGFRVQVRTRYTVGESIIPGTEGQHATAEATAVLEPRCTFKAPDPTPEPEPEPAEPDPKPAEPGPIQGLSCDGDPWEIDPERPRLPSAADLFTVRLAD
ncbi:pilus assembly protein TadG-related protein [Streptomyces vilmorinianum]|uniref:pilus assembly protein TadG-related protein n=1 Tax=Streptomyces vilmorinianum TaxID=3051092 RepID=UPI0010FB4480|nr:pilus assembly protein TadG-related protein [Streptomyces vilmorinianum]